MLGTECSTFLPLQIFVFSFCARGQRSWAQGHRALMFLELGFAYVLSTIPLFPKLLGKLSSGWKKRNNGRIGRYLVLYLCPFCSRWSFQLNDYVGTPVSPPQVPWKKQQLFKPIIYVEIYKENKDLIPEGNPAFFFFFFN